MKKTARERKNKSTSQSIAIGTGISLLVSIIGAAIATSMVLNETASEGAMNIISLVIQWFASALGSLAAGKIAGEKYALIVGITSGIYLLFLAAINIMFFDGIFVNIWLSLLCVAIGAAAACALCISKQGSKQRRKRAVW